MSVSTYLEKFNFYLTNFLTELNTVFPEYNEIFVNNYSDIFPQTEESKSNKTDKYVKDFMSNINEYTKQVAQKDDTIFKGDKEINFLLGLDFRNLWIKDINEKTRESIWKYLQTLYVIGKKVVGEDDEINELLNKFTLQTGDASQEEMMKNIKNETDEMMNMFKNLSQIEQNPDLPNTSENDMKNLFEGGVISDIAKELTNELNLDNLDMGEPNNINEAFANLMGGGNGNKGFFDLVTKVGEKIQNKVQSGEVNQNDLMNEAQKMMGGLKDPNKMANIMKNRQQQHGGATRDRLRKKLEERNKNKSN
mgnify:CR=1 FL=1